MRVAAALLIAGTALILWLRYTHRLDDPAEVRRTINDNRNRR